MTTASLERTKVSILPSAFANINIHKSRSKRLNHGFEIGEQTYGVR
jgi:hypothetical protein